ncbi:MAG: adenosylmethionine decarboxylase [Psychrobium sp.]
MTASKKITSSLVEQQISKSYQVNLIEGDDSVATKDCVVTNTGQHLIADFYGASQLNDIELMEDALTRAAEIAGATLLHVHIHTFVGGGITGVALLAESHISVHTWPELEYAAFDAFMCGDAQPEKAITLLESIFTPSRVELKNIARG